MSEHYIDHGAHRTFRYQARGSDGCQGYSLGSFRTKAEALEAVLEDQRSQERYRGIGPDRTCYDD